MDEIKKISDSLRENVEKKIWNIYTDNTREASSVARQLAFGEGALCWLLRVNGKFPNVIIISLTFLVLFFIFDLIQYLSSALMHYIYGKYYDNLIDRLISEKNEPELKSMKIVESEHLYIGKLFFILKIVCLFIASFYLLSHMMCIFI